MSPEWIVVRATRDVSYTLALVARCLKDHTIRARPTCQPFRRDFRLPTAAQVRIARDIVVKVRLALDHAGRSIRLEWPETRRTR